MPRILIIADDLTGAADCAAGFAERGIDSSVLLGGRSEDAVKAADFEDSEVLAIDADTRRLDALQAAASMTRIVAAFRHSTDLVFKKIDSTLRGNVASELAAVLHARRENGSARVRILLAPAFPECGRTTVDGGQLVHGEPVEHSAFWRREGPRSRSGIAAMLEETGLSCAPLKLSHVRAGASLLAGAMSKAVNEADVVLCDAETETDLAAIAHAGTLLEDETVWAGSAGLARHLAGRWASTHGAFKRSPTRGVHGPGLFVVGSPAETSRQQARALAEAADVSLFTVSASELSRGKTQEHAKLMARCLREGRDVLLWLDDGQVHESRRGPLLAESLALAIAPCVQHAGALLATGGETARAILDAWGIDRLRLLGEVEPGLPYSVAQANGREVLVLTKAGGFGTRQTLVRCRAFMRRYSHQFDTIETRPDDENQKS